MGDFKRPLVSRDGVELEKQGALRDVQANIWERGNRVILKLLGESKIVRDDYKSLKKRVPTASETFTLYAFPIDFDPSKETIASVGLSEDTEVIVYTSMQDWIESDFDFLDIDLIRSTAVIDGKTYKIRDKKKWDMFMDEYLYIVLGLRSL